MTDPYLELSEWRRSVAQMWAAWRREVVESEPAAGAPDQHAAAAGAAGASATGRFRAAKDALFRDHPQSPLPAHQRGAAFSGLAYWPYDPAWRVTARFEPAEQEAPLGAVRAHEGPAGRDPGGAVILPTSRDQPIAFRRIGRLAFDGRLAGQSLSLFWIEGYAGGLFLPFRDLTSGSETYPAGRYLLDTAKGADQGWDPHATTVVIDFNMAYFPSCAYDVCWSCPLAPPENHLPLAIRVGERFAAPSAEAG